MGREIERDHFSEHDYERFQRRLREDLDALGELLARPGLGVLPLTMGAELELHLVDREGRAHAGSARVLDVANDDRLKPEVAKYNVELNSRPVALRGRPFGALAAELHELIARVRTAAADDGARPVAIGILPTATTSDLAENMTTDANRYRALARGIRRLRPDPGTVRIEGCDGAALDLLTGGVACQGACTSFQVHLRVCPDEFASVYNAALLAAGPVLAVSANSPLFLGRELWDETRIALFAQGAFDVRRHDERWRPPRVSFGNGWCTSGILELFADSIARHAPLLPAVGDESPSRMVAAGGAPKLDHLRLHQGTVWPWNRAVYDDADGGHVRIEMRFLPAGPTVVDMVANAAFIIGLSLGLARDVERYKAQMTFAHARRNFLQAARRGLDAELLWPSPLTPFPRAHDACSLVAELLPTARAALVDAGAREDEADSLLGVIASRVAARQTGASWQRRVYRRTRRRRGAEEAQRAVLESYMAHSDREVPVHEWATE